MNMRSSGGIFTSLRWSIKVLFFFTFLFGMIFFMGNSSVYARSLGFEKLVNEVSFYQNRYDDFLNAGQTLQVVSINSFKLGTRFNLEFTYDLNYNLEKKDDFTYYMELGVVKEIFPRFSINYQRIHGSFVDKPVNQVGIRFSF
ncbi:MAG: hypothetical protein WBD28_05285 [Candidatus Zixiibacteriota bacterium]